MQSTGWRCYERVMLLPTRCEDISVEGMGRFTFGFPPDAFDGGEMGRRVEGVDRLCDQSCLPGGDPEDRKMS